MINGDFMKTRIDNALIITPSGLLRDFSMIVEEGFIKDIVRAGDEEKSEVQKRVDAAGQYLAPGLFDIHTHGNKGHDGMDATQNALEVIAKAHVQNGVTSFLANVMTDANETMEKAIKNVETYCASRLNHNNLSTIEGIYLEGPFVSKEKRGAQPLEYIKNPDMTLLKHYIRLSKNSIKVVALAPELIGAESLVNYLEQSGITTAIGHSNADYATTKNVIDAGASMATHIYNGMRGFTHREPGVLGATLLDDRVYAELIVDKIHLHFKAVELALRVKGIDKLILVTDSMRAAGLEGGVYELASQKVIVKNHEARLEDGHLAGSTLKLIDAVRRMITDYGVAIHDAFNMASINPAKALKLNEKMGSLEEGKKADFILLNKDFCITSVFKRGQKIK